MTQHKLGESDFDLMAGFITLGPAAVVLAALDSSVACTKVARPEVIKPAD